MLLQAENIYKNYGQIEVLKGVNLSIHEPGLISIVGASGAGKSTFLHILGTLDEADKGRILIDNTDISSLKKNALASFRNNKIGFIFQFHHLLPEFSVLENTCIPAWIAGKNKTDSRARANELLQILGILHLADKKPNQLSGGEQQRTAVARSLINRPSIVFADEPTGNLDSNNAREMHQLFSELSHRYNQTFVIVTHNEELASQCDRQLTMKDGKMEDE